MLNSGKHIEYFAFLYNYIAGDFLKSITVNMHNDGTTIPVQFYSACEAHVQEPILRHTNDSVFHQILFVIDGTGVFEFEDKSFEIKKALPF